MLARMTWRSDIIAEIESFRTRAGLSERQFGVLAVADSKFIPRLRRGFGVTLKTLERAEHFMATWQQPATVETNGAGPGRPDERCSEAA